MSPLFTIGEVAKQAALRASAIRFYEKAGLLPKPMRAGGQRRYDASVLARLAVLRRAKDCGLSLAEAKALLNQRGPISESWQRIACKKIAELDARIERLRAMQELLQRGCECRDVAECGRRPIDSD